MGRGIGLQESVSENMVRNLALMQRALSVRTRPFQNMDQRATWFLRRLENPDQSLRFRLVLETLWLHFDLLDEMSALDDAPLRLQTRVIELAQTHRTARKIAVDLLSENPIAVLFFSFFAQAVKSGTSKFQIAFSTESEPQTKILVFTPIGWTESMSISANTGQPLKGFALRVSQAGYPQVREFIKFRGSLPDQIDFRWTSESVLEVSLL